MDQEKQRLEQLGKDRRLAEAVTELEQASSELVRVQNDPNATEDDVIQAASGYRIAVQKRNIAFDKACGPSEREPVGLGDRASGPVDLAAEPGAAEKTRPGGADAPAAGDAARAPGAPEGDPPPAESAGAAEPEPAP